MQLTIGQILDDNNEPVGPGDYVEHISRPGIVLLVVSLPYLTKTGNDGINVRTPDGKVVPVYLKNIARV
ncbi:MAG: hypothetical protein M0T74_11485 [Desulfitobacterium hafniense]|nr:hypothetical protein [Desulfitobacterium hafniense]